MRDLHAHRDKLVLSAAECDLAAHLTTDPRERATFERLGSQLKKIADHVGDELATREEESAA